MSIKKLMGRTVVAFALHVGFSVRMQSVLNVPVKMRIDVRNCFECFWLVFPWNLPRWIGTEILNPGGGLDEIRRGRIV